MMEKSKLYGYSIDQWEDEFADIYRIVDPDRKPPEMFLFLVQDASKVAEYIRRERYDKALNKLPHVFNWTCSFVRRCRSTNNLGYIIEKPLSMIVWYKYPKRCSTCGKECCECPLHRVEFEEWPRNKKKKWKQHIEDFDLKDAREQQEGNLPQTLDGFTEMLKNIYREAHYALSIEEISFHFLEEVGEVATCIRVLLERDRALPPDEVNKLGEDLEKEVADVISWTMSLVAKLDYILGAGVCYTEAHRSHEIIKVEKPPQTAGLKLSEIVWGEYQNPKDGGKTLCCPSCGLRTCLCGKILDI